MEIKNIIFTTSNIDTYFANSKYCKEDLSSCNCTSTCE